MNNKRKFLFRTTIILAGFIFLLLNACKGEVDKEPTPIIRPVKVEIVGQTQGLGRNFPGKFQGSQRVNISFRVFGPLIELPVNEGDYVEKGELTARIDPRDYKIALQEANAQYIEANADYKRYKALYERDAVPLADFDVRRAKRETAKSKLENAQANLNDTYLRAPFSGQIGEKYVENFEEVQVGQRILSLNDVTHVDIQIDVPENVVLNIKEDSNPIALAIFDVSPDKEYPLELKEFQTVADPRTQTYKVTYTMDQPDDLNVLPGMTANVVIEGIQTYDKGKEDLLVPAFAVIAGDTGQEYVWIVDRDNLTVHRKNVEVGQVAAEGSIYILNGLKPGDIIATTGVTQLQEGMKIRILEN